MCLILFAYRMHPQYRLIVAANRDEYYGRPAAPAGFWPDLPHILAGRDLEKMGTWMGVTKGGTFAAVTNYRNPAESTAGKRSRGELVARYLRDEPSPREYADRLQEERSLYPGYNLIFGKGNELWYYSNVENRPKTLAPGVYGLSNHLLDTGWPKVTAGKAELERCLALQDEEALKSRLFRILQNNDPAPDHLLPQTGVSVEWERILSPIFIRSESYGTRSSTVLLMKADGLLFEERTFAAGSGPGETRSFRFGFRPSR